MLTFILITVGVIIAACAISHIYQGRDLSTTEIEDISIQLRIDSTWDRIGWATNLVNPSLLRAQKKKMKASGGIHSCNESTNSFPSYSAALLKGKKHEWFIIGWSANKEVQKYWCNKGPNRMMVVPGLNPQEIKQIAIEIGCDVIMDIHNHPNPMPSRLNCTIASDADLKHSESTGSYLSSYSLAYVAFVAERGEVHPYAIFIPPSWSPVSKHREQTIQTAKLGPAARRTLRQRHIQSKPYRYLKTSRFNHNLGCNSAIEGAGYRCVAWGCNSHGQCDVPQEERFTKVVNGRNYCMGLRTDGTAVAWGGNRFGQCDVPAGETFTDIFARRSTSVGLREDGSVVAWGEHGFGELDFSPNVRFLQISFGLCRHTGITKQGELVQWAGTHSALDDLPSGKFISITSGFYHNAALRQDGTLLAWGSNMDGKCDVPEGHTFTAVDAGPFHTIAITAGGTTLAWGGNKEGQCNIPQDQNFKQVSAGSAHSIGLREDGSVISWGKNGYGECDSPTELRFTQVLAGECISVGLVRD